MPRIHERPLEHKGHEVRLFVGDWNDLCEILSPTPVKPSEFIRELVHKSIRKYKERAAQMSHAVEIDDELDLARIEHG